MYNQNLILKEYFQSKYESEKLEISIPARLNQLSGLSIKHSLISQHLAIENYIIVLKSAE